MVNPKLSRYNNPIDIKTGKGYFVPCVAKNKDTLIYFILGINYCAGNILNQMEEGASIKTDLRRDSLRFNDILPDGKKIHELTKNDYAQMEKELREKEADYHPDNNIKHTDHFFSLTCSNCGNSYVFKRPIEIPDKTFSCGLCDRVLIDYTGKDDWEYEFYEA